MSSPSPPASPRDDVLTADVNDDTVFQDLPPRRHDPHTGITVADLMAAQERFGAHDIEVGDADMADVWEEVEEDRGTGLQEPQVALTIRSRQAGLLPAAAGSSAGNPIVVDGAGAAPQVQQAQQLPLRQRSNPSAATSGLVTITQSLRSSRGVSEDEDILLRLRDIVSAAPPFAFPSADQQMTIAWPAFDDYISFEGYSALWPAYWNFDWRHTEGRQDLFDLLMRVNSVGYAFCQRRFGHVDQSVGALLKDLQALAGAILKLSDDIDWNAYLHQPHGRLQWVANKMGFVMDNMLAVIEAEKAYHGIEAITSPVSIDKWQRVRHRFNAVLERTLHWEANLQRGSKFLGQLFADFEDDDSFMKQLRNAMNKPVQEGGTKGWRNFQPGHTKYCAAGMPEDHEARKAHLGLLDLLPFIQVFGPRPEGPHQPKNLGPNARPPTDLAKSQTENNKICLLADGLIEQYSSLLALLQTCSSPAAAGPWEGLLPYVQLNEHNTNPRSILIFKTAFLVLMMADQLWKALMRHEQKGHINRIWSAGKARDEDHGKEAKHEGEDDEDENENENEDDDDDDELSAKVEFGDRLEWMVRVAAVTQVEGAREGLRYEANQRYW